MTASHPGIRDDNLWMQYTPQMTTEELKTYWAKPFSVKPEAGFYAWKKEHKLRLVDERSLTEPETKAFLDFFNDKEKCQKFIELNTIEIKKGEDMFSMDKAMFYCELFESFGPSLAKVFVPYLQKFCASSEESEQRFAAEMVFGLIKGCRFWTFEPVNHLWTEVLVPCFKTILSNVTTETLQDWEICLSGNNDTTSQLFSWRSFYHIFAHFSATKLRQKL